MAHKGKLIQLNGGENEENVNQSNYIFGDSHTVGADLNLTIMQWFVCLFDFHTNIILFKLANICVMITITSQLCL